MRQTNISIFIKPIPYLQQERFGTRLENSETGVTNEPTGTTGLRTPSPGIPFFILVPFMYAACSPALDMEAAVSTETSEPTYQTTRQHTPQNRNLRIHLSENHLYQTYYHFF
jgi:hypothetical protein